MTGTGRTGIVPVLTESQSLLDAALSRDPERLREATVPHLRSNLRRVSETLRTILPAP